MREHDLELLELPAVLARLAAAAASEPGALLAEGLRPSADADEVRLRQQQTTEAIALLDDAAEPDLGGVADVTDAAERAARGSTLDTRSLSLIERTIRAGAAGRRALTARDDLPALQELTAGIELSLLSVAEEIGRSVEEDGSDLKDSASPVLRRLRRELREGRGKLAERLRKIARDPALAEHLQDDFVTERGGRPVLALKASARGRVPGHRARLVGLGADAVRRAARGGRRLEPAPRSRGRRARRGGADPPQSLLARRGSVGSRSSLLVRAAAELDLVIARGTLSRGWRGALVTPSRDVVLRGARHPLLDRASAVPIDLELGSLRALVISGPNTGGKTVALKTLGLAAALYQSGLRPPADEASLPVFDEILVDIGDEQSIAMSLSTFSAHLRNLVGILERATAESLVLLDEIAAGTDPVEGAALAEALLDRLASQARLTVTTSHFAELKEWASAADGAANAATGIDPETNEPLYTVTLGRPGTSHALQTAERLGLPAPIVAAARDRIAPERLQVAELVAEAEAAAREAHELRDGSRRGAAGGGDGPPEGAARSRGPPGRDRAGAVVGSGRAAARSGARPRRSSRTSGRSSRSCGPRSGRHGSSSASAAARRRRPRRRRRPSATAGSGAASDRAVRASRSLARLDEPLALTAPLAAGDPVVAPELGVRGTIAEIVAGEATVLGRGGLRIRVPLDRLRPDRDVTPADRAGRARRHGPGDDPERPSRRDRPPRANRAGGARGRPRPHRRGIAGRAGGGARDPRPRHRRGAQGRSGRAREASARRGAGVGFGRRGDRCAARRQLSGGDPPRV